MYIQNTSDKTPKNVKEIEMSFKKHILFIILTFALIAIGCSGGNSHENSGSIEPTDSDSRGIVEVTSSELDDLDTDPNWDDWDVVLLDEDGWYLFLDNWGGSGSYQELSGIVYYTCNGYSYSGFARGIFDVNHNVFHCLAKWEAGWGTYDVSYSLSWETSGFIGSYLHSTIEAFSLPYDPPYFYSLTLSVEFLQGQLGSLTAEEQSPESRIIREGRPKGPRSR